MRGIETSVMVIKTFSKTGENIANNCCRMTLDSVDYKHCNDNTNCKNCNGIEPSDDSYSFNASDFERIVTEEWQGELSHFSYFVKFLEKRKKMEAQFVTQLTSLEQELQQYQKLKIPKNYDASKELDSEKSASIGCKDAFAWLQKGIAEERKSHLRNVRFIEDRLLCPLKDELDFQEKTQNIILKDVQREIDKVIIDSESVHPVPVDRESMLPVDRESKLPVPQRDKVFVDKRPQGHTDKRVQRISLSIRQCILLRGAFLRMSELEGRRLSFHYSAIYQLYTHLQTRAAPRQEKTGIAGALELSEIYGDFLRDFPQQEDLHEEWSLKMARWLSIFTPPSPSALLV